MSYMVPRDKPDRCIDCIFVDRITYDCMLMYEDYYSDFEAQYNHCPLVEIPTPHGRIIDVSTVEEIRFHDADGYHVINGEQLCELEIDAPILIEGSEK